MRLLINWKRSRALRIAKMLAWTLVQHEHLSEQRLWLRMVPCSPRFTRG